MKSKQYAVFREHGLTNREADVAVLACTRLTITEIADNLGIKLQTTVKYLKYVGKKLKITGRADLTMWSMNKNREMLESAHEPHGRIDGYSPHPHDRGCKHRDSQPNTDPNGP